MPIEIAAEARADKTPRQLRREGFVPAVVYGTDTHEQIQITDRNLSKALSVATRSSRFSVQINGSNYDAFLREVQYHPLNDNVLHVDFYQPKADQNVTMHVPIQLNGTPVGLKMGGNLFKILDYLPVRGRMENIPERIEVEITNMDVGSVLRLGDLQLEGVSMLLPLDSTVATVKIPRRVAMELEADEEAAAEGEEGEAPAEGEADAAEEASAEEAASEE